MSLLSLSEALACVLAVSGVVGGLIQSLHILLLALEEKKGGEPHTYCENYYSFCLLNSQQDLL
jgi:hypothetical protein